MSFSNNISSSPVLCRYFFQAIVNEDDPDGETLCSSIILSSHPTLAEIREKFPFVGTYHFRLQQKVDLQQDTTKVSYVWVDLLEKDDKHILPVSNNREICLKVLQISPESPPEPEKNNIEIENVDVPESEAYQKFFYLQNKEKSARLKSANFSSSSASISSVLSGMKSVFVSSLSGTSTLAMAQNLHSKSTKMWAKVTTTAASTQSNPPSAVALAQLVKLISALNAHLSASNREHLVFLNRLWTSCSLTSATNEEFNPMTPAWQTLGFATNSPLKELEVLLPLQCLVFFTEVYPTETIKILQNFIENNGYPLAPVGARVAFLLAHGLQLPEGACVGCSRPFWPLFEDPQAFFELFSLGMRVFQLSWYSKTISATNDETIETQFIRHMETVDAFVWEILQRQPNSVSNMKRIGEDMIRSW